MSDDPVELRQRAPFVAIVPARLASTRLPNKPLADIGGVPMVVRVARQAVASGAEQVWVATDAQSVVEVCEAHGVHALMTSPDHPTGTDRLAEVAERLGLPDAAVVVNVQGDEPLIPPTLIDDVAQALASATNCAIATCAHPITDYDEIFNPNVVKVVADRTGRALYFSRAPIPYGRDKYGARIPIAPGDPPILRHVGIYAYRAAFLRLFPTLQMAPLEQFESLEQLRAIWHGFGIHLRVIPQAPPGGVDTPDDLERVRRAIAPIGA
ncbi:MAG: 3-deoxy-manno-octulosonate cytidylyltransferase [Burkholderiaceae bacterium]